MTHGVIIAVIEQMWVLEMLQPSCAGNCQETLGSLLTIRSDQRSFIIRVSIS